MNKFERLLAKTALPDGCWEWTAFRNRKGYGLMRSGTRADSRTELAHRAMWEAIHGPIIGGMHVLHRCDNPPCVRPDHLYLGTPADNATDRTLRARGRAKLTADKVRLMRQAYEAGWTLTALAQQFGISVPSTYEAVKRRTWKHVD